MSSTRAQKPRPQTSAARSRAEGVVCRATRKPEQAHYSPKARADLGSSDVQRARSGTQQLAVQVLSSPKAGADAGKPGHHCSAQRQKLRTQQPDSHCKRKAARQPGQHESHTARRRRGARCPVHAQRSRALKLVQPGAGQKESCAGQPESPSSSKPVDVDGVMITSSVYDMPLGRPCMQPGCSGATIGFSAIWSWA